MKGSIQVKVKTGGGYAEDGTPIPVSVAWSKPIPCQIVPNSTGTLRKYEDGQYVSASYQIVLKSIKKIVIENQGVESSADFDPKQIRIADCRNTFDYGDIYVLPQNVRYLDALQRILILI